MKVTQVSWLLFLIPAITLSGAVFSQSISKSVIGNTGSTLSTDNYKLTFTVGEPVTGIMTGTGNQLGNGFLSSLDLSVLAIPEYQDIPLFDLYPNPAASVFTCRQKDGHPVHLRAYNTVVIGNRVWMTQNLKVTHYSTGGAYAWYNNNMEWKNIYGGLYNYYAVVNQNGLCPEGWHVPGVEE